MNRVSKAIIVGTIGTTALLVAGSTALADPRSSDPVGEKSTTGWFAVAPLSMPLKLLAKRVNAYFEANTDWCDEHCQYFVLTEGSAPECNSLVKALNRGLSAELDDSYQIYPVLAGIDNSGHIAIISDEGQTPSGIIWTPHACQ